MYIAFPVKSSSPGDRHKSTTSLNKFVKQNYLATDVFCIVGQDYVNPRIEYTLRQK